MSLWVAKKMKTYNHRVLYKDYVAGMSCSQLLLLKIYSLLTNKVATSLYDIMKENMPLQLPLGVTVSAS